MGLGYENDVKASSAPSAEDRCVVIKYMLAIIQNGPLG